MLSKRVNKFKLQTERANVKLSEAIEHFNKAGTALAQAADILEEAGHITRGRPRKCYCGTCPRCKESARSKRYRDKKKNKLQEKL